MSVFTVVIIIWVIYQLGASLMKKGKRQIPGNFTGPLKFPNGRSIRADLQDMPQRSWREQMQQALENTSRQMEEWTVHGESLESAQPKGFMDDYVQTEGTQGIEGTQGVEGTQGIEGTSTYEETNRVELYRVAEGDTVEGIPKGTQAMSGINLYMTKRELVQGVVWAEVLGKPRALHSFRGPRA